MQTNSFKRFHSIAIKNIAYFLILAGGNALFSSHGVAQQVYRIVSPDGKVTFSDQPPPPTANAKVSNARTNNSAASEDGAGLPFELRGVAQRFPVTLYTRSTDCPGCVSGRAMLKARGIPFTERMVEGKEDIDAMTKQLGGVTVPMLTVGAQQLKGYSDAEWNQYLDVAGYPKASQLPATYRAPAAAPLVAKPASAAAPVTAPATPPSPVRAPAANNPAGIRF